MKDNHKGAICEAEIILNLIKQCESLKISSQHLKEHLITDAKSISDQVWVKEINILHQQLIYSVEKLTESTKDLHVRIFSFVKFETS